MTGQELAGFVRRERPETKILYMSGYTDRGIEDVGLGEPGIAFLQKPFSVEGLARKVREVLDAQSNRVPRLFETPSGTVEWIHPLR